jgi:glycosyltransferase involved in cell wall biosynthesis
MEPFKIATPRPSAPITVVIPVFNAERFVGRALKMLAFQTVLPSEIIIVDDGSTDNTAAIAENTSARVIRARPQRAGSHKKRWNRRGLQRMDRASRCR